MTTTPTPQQVGRVQAAIDRILDGDADRYVGAYYNAEARSYPTAKGVLSPGRYFDELQTNNVRAFTVGDLAAASLLDVRFGRKPKHSRGLTRQDRKAAKFPDLLRRHFTACAVNVKWCGDLTEIPTDEGKLYLATVLDLFSRRLLACPTRARQGSGCLAVSHLTDRGPAVPRRGVAAADL